MQYSNDKIDSKTWTISEAKSRLSELLRMAKDEPQYIGTKKAYVLITADTWQAMNHPQESMGPWLINALSGIGELKIPDRTDPEREIPFQ